MENELDPVGTWEIEVLDDFSAAVIVFKAVPLDGGTNDGRLYDLKPTGWTLDVLRRFHAETGRLIAYMESGVTRHPTTRQ